jgi:hypothetical protein
MVVDATVIYKDGLTMVNHFEKYGRNEAYQAEVTITQSNVIAILT